MSVLATLMSVSKFALLVIANMATLPMVDPRSLAHGVMDEPRQGNSYRAPVFICFV
jgi:hypothetical protein